MCGRFTLTASADDVAAHFGAAGPAPALGRRYNVAPTQVIAVVGVNGAGERRLGALSWGLVRGWANDPADGPRPINARAETLLDKPMFRELFLTKRCLVPTDGFYEWRKAGTRKQPHHIRLRGGGLMAFAGLWDVWDGGGGRKLASCCIVTTAANELTRPIHDRMPVIIPPAEFDRWLDPGTPRQDLAAMLRPFPADQMEAVPVGLAVNKVANDGPECLEPAA